MVWKDSVILSERQRVEGSWQPEIADVTGAKGAAHCLLTFGAKILRLRRTSLRSAQDDRIFWISCLRIANSVKILYNDHNSMQNGEKCYGQDHDRGALLQ